MTKNHSSARLSPLSVVIEGENQSEEWLVADSKTAGFEFIASQAFTMAVINGLHSMGREGYERYAAYEAGQISIGEFLSEVIKKGGSSAAVSGVKTVGALYLKEGIDELARRFGKNAFRRFANSYAATAIAFGLMDQGYDTLRWVGGRLSDRDYKVSTAQNVGATGGAIGGAAIGATLGSFVPFLGTGIGAILGGMFGGYAGAENAKTWGEQYFEPETAPVEEDSAP